ncbi:MAG: hypothetical protein JNM36_02765 [Chitinophagales bacterium]|jgi:hypothetical protein|nr:hypothetical protein [Chitinophagales bacterium]
MIMNIKYRLLIGVLCLLGIQACQNIPQNTPTALLSQKLPLLHHAISDTSQLSVLVECYLQSLHTAADSVKTETELLYLFEERSDLQQQLHIKLLDSLAANQHHFYFDQNGDALEKELRVLGLKPIIAERIYVGLAPVPMVQDLVKRLASPACRLYIDALNECGTSKGGYYYPYTDLNGRVKLLTIAEQLLQQYPHSPYTVAIEPFFRDALNVLTDIHAVAEFDTSTTIIAFGLNSEPYPTATDTFYHHRFVEEKRDSRYRTVVQSILNNLSTIQLNYYFQPRELYMIVTDWYPYVQTDGIYTFTPSDTLMSCCPTATQQRNQYIDAGIDIPHVALLHVGNTKQKICALAYRFYADKAAAEAQLEYAHHLAGHGVDLVTLKCDIAHYLENPPWRIIAIEKSC